MRASSLDPSWVGAFNAVGGRCVLPYQVTLVTWYATVRSSCVSVLHVGAGDLGGTE